ncbi:MAG: 16S rRNA (adenine(1518)-N(6)/adenine(1519)-N(6))-dimethyltransferase, partial [Candidatus Staskawiczbacteria bacterium]|nr:16S rRNA (adenine(1518)-N(6)/adenine(1519)-N(6))-dimethyltransferase [Candidatus Staskawiczbacteria bacterium]
DQVKQVIAIEKDDELSGFLEKTIQKNNLKNIKIINNDILKVNPEDYQDFKIIANLPYYISGQFLRIFLAHRHQDSFLMLQKEVAQRIVAGPPNHSLLSLSVQFYSNPEILFIVKANNFHPIPKVDSAFIRLTPTTYDLINEDYFFKTIKMAFASKRQTLLNNLKRGFQLNKNEIEKILESLNINPKKRAQELSLDDYIKLAKILPH